MKNNKIKMTGFINFQNSHLVYLENPVILSKKNHKTRQRNPIKNHKTR